jgi:hypothetical protein
MKKAGTFFPLTENLQFHACLKLTARFENILFQQAFKPDLEN